MEEQWIRMEEQWITEADKVAKKLAKTLSEYITDEAHNLRVEREWYFEKVIQYMRAESEDKDD